MESHLATECKFFFGGATYRIDLTPDFQTLALNAEIVAPTAMQTTGPGKLGMSVKGVTVRFNAQMGMLRTDDNEGLIMDRLEGILFCAETDSDTAWAFPAVMTAVPTTHPSEGYAMLTATFAGRNTSGMVMDDLVDAGDDATGETKYVVGPTSVTLSDSGTVPAGGYGVGGTAITGEGI